MEHPNAMLMRKVDDALLAGDFPGFLALHTEDAVMHVPGSGPLSGDHYGRDGIAAVFQREMSMLDAPPEIVPLDDLGSDDHAVRRAYPADATRRPLVRGPTGGHRPSSRWTTVRDLVPAAGPSSLRQVLRLNATLPATGGPAPGWWAGIAGLTIGAWLLIRKRANPPA